MARDLTKTQFDAKCKKLGFAPQGFLGYHRLASSSVHVSVENAGPRRRARLAYLIQQDAQYAEPPPPGTAE